MTTPREDAIAALIEAARYVLDRLDTMVERQTLTGAEISRQQLSEALAALGAEAETPDAPFHCEGCIASKDGRDWQCLGIALGAEAETPVCTCDWDASLPARHRPGCAMSAGHWVDLASPEFAEELARALCFAQEAGQRLEDVAASTADHWRGVADRALAAMRETGR